MTTPVTIRAQTHPIEVTETANYTDPVGRRCFSSTTFTLAPNSEATFHLLAESSLSFKELPIPHDNADAVAVTDTTWVALKRGATPRAEVQA